MAGRPPGEKSFAAALRIAIKEASEELDKDGNKKDQLRVIADKLVKKAKEGDMQAINAVADRLDGKPKQQIEGDIKGGLTIVISDKDADTA